MRRLGKRGGVVREPVSSRGQHYSGPGKRGQSESDDCELQATGVEGKRHRDPDAHREPRASAECEVHRRQERDDGSSGKSARRNRLGARGERQRKQRAHGCVDAEAVPVSDRS